MQRFLRAGSFSVIALAALAAVSSVSLAADANGIPLCTVANDQVLPVTVSDGAGGIIVVWQDARGGGAVYGQRLNAAGVAQWTADGVALSTTGDVNPPVIASDGAGGAFIAFSGSSSFPRAQRVNGSGVPQWGPDGVQLTTEISSARDLAIAQDLGGSGGAIVAWRKINGVAGTSDVYAQRVDASGVIQWNSAGIVIAATNMNNESNPAVVSDGVGGGIFAWISSGVRASRLNAAGTSVWGPANLAGTGSNNPPVMVSDGANGAVVAWFGGGAFIQRVTSIGDRLWNPPNGGVPLSLTGRAPQLIANGPGGAIVAWEDNRSATNFNIYAQKVSSTGAPQWTTDGSPICMASADQRAAQIVDDGAGGGIISWYDARMSGSQGNDIYAQRVNGAGTIEWPLDGVAVCTAPNHQDFPTMASDGAGGAWIAWEDLRNGNQDIFASHLGSGGAPLAVTPQVRTDLVSRAWPCPFSERVTMEFVMPVPATVRMMVYDVDGRAVADLGSASLPGGPSRIAWDGRSDAGHTVGAGVYFVRVDGPGLSLSRPVVRMR